VTKFSQTRLGVAETDLKSRQHMLSQYSVQEKEILIERFATGTLAAKSAMSNSLSLLANVEADDDALEFLAKLTEDGASVAMLEELQKILLDADELWLDDFVSAGGAEMLFEFLVAAVHKPSE
jgi:hypothetical protein